jgi:hypothetical protein
VPDRSSTLGLVALLFLPACAGAQTVPLPARAPDAPAGSEFIRRLASLDFTNREQEILSQVRAGNVPEFLRRFCPVTVTNVSAGKTNAATFFVAPDYLAVGSDEDYFLTPMTPVTAQRIADALGCSLATRKMVDAIYAAAEVKLAPSPIAPGPAMITVPVFAQHNAMVRTQRWAQRSAHRPGALVAGDKKDVVISPKLAGVTNRVAIYGWHQTNGTPIQPLYLGHASAWVDYSHGIRLVQQKLTVNGKRKTVAEVLADPNLAGLLSDEGVITAPRYPTSALPPVPSQREAVFDSARTNRPRQAAVETESDAPTPDPSQEGNHLRRDAAPLASGASGGLDEFKPSGHFGELVSTFTFTPEVKIHVNAPAGRDFGPDKPVLLVFYGLPNGNTTGQTIGRRLKPGDDWRFDIQHLGAQTRFLRNLVTNRTIVIAYLEADMKSWPAWRKKHGDRLIPEILEAVKKIFATYRIEVALTGHSGGGSFTFGYLNAVQRIPDDVVRVAFLDSNYAYDPASGHTEKLVQWLEPERRPPTRHEPNHASQRAGSETGAPIHHCLCVLAYDDANALLDGKSFVSVAGGTWGRSQAMLRDLGDVFQFSSRTNRGLRTHSALDGRIQFLLKENPERKILHTVQVERNGFIHAMVSGTAYEGKGYEYLGERAYTKWIPDGEH